MKYIDARGQACPIPVLMTKKEMDSGEAAISVVVDNPTAVENLKRLGGHLNYSVAVDQKEDCFEVVLSKEDQASPQFRPREDEACPPPKGQAGWALFVGSEGIGAGSDELGGNLMTMFFYTLSQGGDLPRSILFMNGGVKLPTLNGQVVEHLQALQEKGCEILVCGTCLNYYGLQDELKIGTVSNMYDISSRLLEAGKVIQF